MFRFHIVQADHGDCYLVEYGVPCALQAILIDGGPGSIYARHLLPVLQDESERCGKLPLMVLTHIDDDHIGGLLELLIELRQQRSEGVSETIGIEEIWHNTFSQVTSPEIEQRIARLLRQSFGSRGLSPIPEETIRSVSQGDELTQHAVALQIPINASFGPYRPISVEDVGGPTTLGNLTLHVLGPTHKSLEKLRKAWTKWLSTQENHMKPDRCDLAETVAIDQSVPNLSSILLLAVADGKTILLTGDSTSEQVLQGLGQTNWLDASGKLHVDILKLPHHGSRRNVKKSFFSKITADRYVISANGRDGNPDLTTLKWLVNAAKTDRRAIEVCVTNRTESTDQLMVACPPSVYGYQIRILPPEAHSMCIDLSA